MSNAVKQSKDALTYQAGNYKTANTDTNTSGYVEFIADALAFITKKLQLIFQPDHNTDGDYSPFNYMFDYIKGSIFQIQAPDHLPSQPEHIVPSLPLEKQLTEKESTTQSEQDTTLKVEPALRLETTTPHKENTHTIKNTKTETKPEDSLDDKVVQVEHRKDFKLNGLNVEINDRQHQGTSKSASRKLYDRTDKIDSTEKETNPNKTVNPEPEPQNLSPRFVGRTEVNVAENHYGKFAVRAIDPEGEYVYYQIAGGADAQYFIIDFDTGALAINP
ncbi:MAG: hypothetical protein K0U12_00205, partial [Gammaproteobacteria bacterium]|nr:hypothetical protein [Gammaproteobacteria bacterium]